MFIISAKNMCDMLGQEEFDKSQQFVQYKKNCVDLRGLVSKGFKIAEISTRILTYLNHHMNYK